MIRAFEWFLFLPSQAERIAVQRQARQSFLGVRRSARPHQSNIATKSISQWRATRRYRFSLHVRLSAFKKKGTF